MDVRRREVDADQYMAELVRATKMTGRLRWGDGEPVPEPDARTVALAATLLVVVATLLCGATWIYLTMGSLWA